MPGSRLRFVVETRRAKRGVKSLFGGSKCAGRRYVTWRLNRLLVKKRRNLRAGQADQWTVEWFNGHGLHRLRGTIRYPKGA